MSSQNVPTIHKMPNSLVLNNANRVSVCHFKLSAACLRMRIKSDKFGGLVLVGRF